MTQRTEFVFGDMITVVEASSTMVKAKLAEIQARASSTSIGDMFDMQMMMNRLNQLSEMVTNVMSAAHQAVMSMARNIK